MGFAGLKALRRGEHVCTVCGVLTDCPLCKQTTQHNVRGDYVCEKGCSHLGHLERKWREEMRRAKESVV